MGSSGSRSDVRASSDRSAGRQQQQRRRQDAKLALNELAYYHSHVDNSEEAQKVLGGRPVGSFILRNCSGKHKGVCAVSVVVERDNGKHSERILRHFDIRLHKGSFFFERKRPFKTLQALVDYYGKHDVPNSRGIVGVRLSIPFEKLHSRPARGLPPLPADAETPKQAGEAPDSSLQSKQLINGVYSYTCLPDHTDNLITYLEQQAQQQQLQSSRQGPRSDRTDNLITYLEQQAQQQRLQSSRRDPRSVSESSSASSNSRGIVGVPLSIPFEKLHSRPARGLPPLPADAATPKQAGESPDSSLQSRQLINGVYSYACLPDRTDNLITYLEQQAQQQRLQSPRRGPRSVSESSSTSGKCTCGIWWTDGALPGGWAIHQNVREHVVFYKDADGLSQWTLPPEIFLSLSDKQRDFIEYLTALVKSGGGYGINP